ncbi:hypothetical protein FBU30_009882 [Linnemannia zychae]|nr:hypothetical protein FBU30_009882 [Linnemannia zychae]
MLKALDLPEIRSTIASFLSPHDLLSCMLVSHTWHDSFYPWRWHTINLHGVHSIHDDVLLRRHAAYVRTISFLRVTSLKHLSSVDSYSRVRRVRITGAGEEGRVVWGKIAGLVRGCKGGMLREVVVEDSTPLIVFLTALAGCEERHESQQQLKEVKEYSDSENEDESEDGRGEGRFGVIARLGTLMSLASSTTSVNTTDTIATTVTPLSSIATVTTMTAKHYSYLRGSDRRLDVLVWKRIKVSATNLDQLWLASKGAKDLVLECLTITGIPPGYQPSTARALASNEGNTTYPLHPLINSSPIPSIHTQALRVSWIIGLSVEWQLDLWIRPCRELRSLTWEAPTFSDPLLFGFAKNIEAGCWPWLTSLEISACVAPFPSDAAIARILSASAAYFSSPPCSPSSSSPSIPMDYSLENRNTSFESPKDSTIASRSKRSYHPQHYHRWERLVFRTVGFGPLAFEALRKHFGTLKTVKWIGYVGGVTNDMAREVLENCPQLEEFHAPFLWVEDFKGSKIKAEGEDFTLEQIHVQIQEQQQQVQQHEQPQRHQKQQQLQNDKEYEAKEAAMSAVISSPSLKIQPNKQPWRCQGLKHLFISATSPNFFSPPLSRPEEAIIRTRLASLKELTYYCVGSTIFSTPFRHDCS